MSTSLPGHKTPALLTRMSIRPHSLSTLLTTLFRLSSSVTSRTTYQKPSKCPSSVQALAKSPFRSFREKNPASLRISGQSRRPCTLRRQTPRICRAMLVFVSGCTFCVGREAYSANPIPPLEQPVIRTTFDSALADILMRLPDPKRNDAETLFYKGGLNLTGMKGTPRGSWVAQRRERKRGVDKRLGPCF